MSKPDAYHAGYDAGVRDERKRRQQEIGSLKEQLADARLIIDRLRSSNDSWLQGAEDE